MGAVKEDTERERRQCRREGEKDNKTQPQWLKIKLEIEATGQRLAGDKISDITVTSMAPKYSDVIAEYKEAGSNGRTTDLENLLNVCHLLENK